MSTSLLPAAGPWQDATPKTLPPLGERVLCRFVGQDRLFVARRMPLIEGAWHWQWGTKEFVEADTVDQWAIIKLRD